MITADNVTMSYGGRTLFEKISALFKAGNRYGLTGPNGAGKSTFLKILMGDVQQIEGSVTLPEKTGFLKQDIEAFKEIRVLDVVIMGNEKLWKAMEERDSLYEGEMTDAVGMRLGELEEIVANEDGYTAESEAESLLSGMGIDEEFFEKVMKEIPSDLQFRVLLCQALFGNPEALLLDEPTNHLDLSSITWLENFLKAYTGTLVVVSHDRHFLNAVTTHIADIDYETLILYPGNYDAMVVSKSASREGELLEQKSKEKKISQLKEFVAKFSAGTRASQVQSRIKEINRLQPQELKKSNIQRPYIRFPSPEKQSGKIVLKTKKLCKAYDAPVIENFSCEIHKGQKVAVIGNNGRGKTTLLKMLAGVLKPDSGEIETGHQVSIGYFPQNHQDIIDKTRDITLFDWLKEMQPKAYDQDVRGVLGKMLFSGDDVFKKVATLSGGETARLILGLLMLHDYNTLILDEPNNHLDLEAVSALGVGITDFPGTILFASHDRDLLTSADTVIALEENKIEVFNGPIEEYLSSK